MQKMVLALFLAFAGTAVPQQSNTPAPPDQQADTSFDDVVITDPAEYDAYVAAINIVDPAAQAQALEAFARKFPSSLLLQAALEQAEEDRAEALSIRKDVKPTSASVPDKLPPTPPEKACQAIENRDPNALSFQEWEFVLRYRDAGAQCNRDAAERIWRWIQNWEKNATGELTARRLPVKVIAVTSTAIEVAITDENQKVNRADLSIRLTRPLAHPPSPGTTLDALGVITGYIVHPFMFIMNGTVVSSQPKTGTSR
jgi:hypothetical protein